MSADRRPRALEDRGRALYWLIYSVSADLMARLILEAMDVPYPFAGIGAALAALYLAAYLERAMDAEHAPGQPPLGKM